MTTAFGPLQETSEVLIYKGGSKFKAMCAILLIKTVVRKDHLISLAGLLRDILNPDICT